VKAGSVFKCPADKSLTVMADNKAYPRTRSYAMNTAMGNDGANLTRPGSHFEKRSDLSKVHRAELFVFIDEQEDFIDTCDFGVGIDRNLGIWRDLPASRHSGSGVLSYTDGHAEIHRWKDPFTRQPVTGIPRRGPQNNVYYSPDWRYVYVRLSKTTPEYGEFEP
jgi:prepilin-type processing-associated H-X9-DG protein